MSHKIPHLFALSHFTNKRSMLSPAKLAALGEDSGFACVCDDGYLASVYELDKYASKKNLKTVVGEHLSINGLPLTLHVINDAGWSRLCQIDAKLHLNQPVDFTDIGCGDLFCTISANSSELKAWLNTTNNAVQHLIDAVGLPNMAIAAIRKPGEFSGYDIAALAYDHNIPIIAAPIPAYESLDDEDALIAIREDEPERLPVTHALTDAEIEEAFSDIPDSIKNLTLLAKKCADFKFKTQKPMLPHYISSFDEDFDICEQSRLSLEEKIVRNNLPRPEDYRSRLEYELNHITKLKFSGYFLIVADFIRHCEENDIPVGPGRGSGAGSVVAWCLGITKIDPIRYGLYFERFINPERISPPDFDTDFCEQRREEVIDYVVQKYGADKVAQIGAWTTLKPRAAWRTAARASGLSMGQSNSISKIIDPKSSDLKTAVELSPELQKILPADAELRETMKLAMQIEGVATHRTRHAAGIIIADNSLSKQTPLIDNEGGPANTPASQFDMKGVEAQGLVKFDFLGLKTLTIVQKTKDLLKAQGIDIDPWDCPYDDPKVMAMLRAGWVLNVFQLESDGMRKSIRDIRIENFEDIIALVALYRPGPMDQIPVYAKRKNENSQIHYPHPALESSLKETYGIPVYQEQIMDIGRTLAGYSLGKADVLRRAMGKKIASEMAALKEGFIEGCVNNDAISPRVTQKQAEDIFSLIEKFAEYGFNKSHATAYARITFVTAWLKNNFYHEFMCACMDQSLNDLDHLAKCFQEARSLKTPVKILPVDINQSSITFQIETNENTKSIRYSFCAIKGVGTKCADNIIAERAVNGRFKSFEDFFYRMSARSIRVNEISALIDAGAFDALKDNPFYESRPEFHYLSETMPKTRDTNQIGLGAIFDSTPKPDFSNLKEQHYAEVISRQNAVYGYANSHHPVDPYRKILTEHQIPSLFIAKKANREMKVTTLGLLSGLNEKDGRISGYLSDVETINGKLVRTRIDIKFPTSIMPPLPHDSTDNVFIFTLDQNGTVEKWQNVQNYRP
jgi:DNA polymerase III subunit alpha